MQSSITYTLAANVENLILTGGGQHQRHRQRGSSNDITGNAGNNFIIVNGGGADTARGGLGDDLYRVDGADTVIENAGEGTDTVRSVPSYTLGANIERLILEGVGNTSGTGNTLDNRLTGNTGNNTLTGGLGRDMMFGDLGADRFDFNALAESGVTAATRDIDR